MAYTRRLPTFLIVKAAMCVSACACMYLKHVFVYIKHVRLCVCECVAVCVCVPAVSGKVEGTKRATGRAKGDPFQAVH